MQVIRTVKACCANRDYARAQAAADKHSITFSKYEQEPAYLVRVSHLELLVWVTHHSCCLCHAVTIKRPVSEMASSTSGAEYHEHEGQLGHCPLSLHLLLQTLLDVFTTQSRAALYFAMSCIRS